MIDGVVLDVATRAARIERGDHVSVRIPLVPRLIGEARYDLAHEDHPSLGNTLGQLAWVEDDAGAVFLGYDDRGRLTDRIRRFPAAKST